MFETMFDSVPTALAVQDALSNSIGGGTPAGPAAGGTLPAGPIQQQAPQNPFGSALPFIIIAVFFIGYMMLSSSREKKRRAQLLASIKKGERVLTIGGIIGTVADVRDEEVTLRIDENSNVKMRVTRSAIQQVLASAPGGESGGDSGGAAAQVEVKAGKNAKVGA